MLMKLQTIKIFDFLRKGPIPAACLCIPSYWKIPHTFLSWSESLWMHSQIIKANINWLYFSNVCQIVIWDHLGTSDVLNYQVLSSFLSISQWYTELLFLNNRCPYLLWNRIVKAHLKQKVSLHNYWFCMFIE